MTTNYINTFIAISPDSDADHGMEPRAGTIAGEHLRLLRDHPYTVTSDELLFRVHAERALIPKSDLRAAREDFFSKPKACLRASPLVKRYGWGLHHDAEGRLAAFAVDSAPYRRFVTDGTTEVVKGMRSKRT